MVVTLASLGLAASSGVGCDDGADGTGGGGASSSSTSSSSSSSTVASSSSTGAGVCVPGLTEACYSGPANTQNIGTCKAGTRTCDAAGSAFGPCEGEVIPQPELCANPADTDCDGQDLVCSGAHTWSKGFSGSMSQSGVRVAADASANVFVTGNVYGAIDLGGGALSSAGGSDVFVGKLAPDGQHLWSKRFGDAQFQSVTGMAIDASGNVLIAGQFTGPIDLGGGPLGVEGASTFVAKLSPTGAHVWSKAFHAPSLMGVLGVAVDAMGNVLLTGGFAGDADLGGGLLTYTSNYDSFVAKLDPNGQHVWSRGLGGPGNQETFAVTADFAGNVIVTGRFASSLEAGGLPIASNGSTDVFVASYAPDGAHVWSEGFGDATDQEAHSVAVTASGDVLLTGQFAGTLDFGGGALTSAGDVDAFLAKLSAAGQHVWSKRFGGAGAQRAHDVATDAAGHVLVTGEFEGAMDLGGGTLTSAGLRDVFVAKYLPGGEPVWSRRAGDAAQQFGASVSADANGNVLLTGGYEGTMDLGGGALPVGLAQDAFLAKLAP